MSRILFAWELGSNLGHLARDIPLALACRDAGHDVRFASTQVAICRKVLGPYGFEIIEAPTLDTHATTHRGAINFADLLLQNGFAHPDSLNAAISAWLEIFDRVRPDALVYDFAPRALTAATLVSLPTLLLGNGFEIPPQSSPLPSFRPWEPIPEAAHLRAETELVARLNVVFGSRGGRQLTRLWDLYSTSPALIAYTSEFDHFGPRSNVEYVGPASQLPACQVIEPAGVSPFIVVYLRASIPGIENVFIALQQLDADIVCFVPDMPAAWPRRYSRLRLTTEPVDLVALLPFAKLVITHGSGTSADAVMAGVPVLMVPSVIEQYLAGVPIERQGAGLILRQRRTVAQVLAAVERMRADDSFCAAAKVISSRYSNFRASHSVARQFETLKGLMR